MNGEVMIYVSTGVISLGVAAICVAGARDNTAWQWAWSSVGLVLTIVGLALTIAGARLVFRESK